MTYTQPFPLAQPTTLEKPSFAPDLAVRLVCSDCRDPIPDIREEFSSGDLVCGNCGLVLGDWIVDTRSEWRTFADNEGDDPSRVGASLDPLLDGFEQLETVISFKDGGSGAASELLRAASRSVAGRSERNLITAFRDISNTCGQFSLPKTISDIAKQLYKRTEEEKLLKGKSLQAVIAACIFIACRQAHVPRTFKEISQLTRVPPKTIGQCSKAMQQAFDLSQNVEENDGVASSLVTPGIEPEGLLARYCNHLDLPPNFQRICVDVIRLAREHGIAMGRSPISIAGGAIFFICHLLGHPKSSKDISAVVGTREDTVKLVYRLYYRDREKIVPPAILESGRGDLKRLPSEIGK